MLRLQSSKAGLDNESDSQNFHCTLYQQKEKEAIRLSWWWSENFTKVEKE